MKMDLNDPVYRTCIGAAGLAIYTFQGYFLHRVFVKKRKIRAKWGRFGGGRVLSRFAFAAWASLFLVVASDLICAAVSVGGRLPFVGAFYVISTTAIFSAAIYDYTRHEERAQP